MKITLGDGDIIFTRQLGGGTVEVFCIKNDNTIIHTVENSFNSCSTSVRDGLTK